MNDFNDINKDLKDFVKHILEGKYDDEFIKIYRNSYYDKTSNDITLRETRKCIFIPDYGNLQEPVCRLTGIPAIWPRLSGFCRISFPAWMR